MKTFAERVLLGAAGWGLLLFMFPPPLRRNAAGKRRTSSRRRSKGRPGAHPVHEDHLRLKMPWGVVEAEIRSGILHAEGETYGSIYDMGTSFRAIPFGGPPKNFGTLAGAAKHILLRAWTESA